MKFDTPATTNPIDNLKVVGRPTHRVDGALKTTGRATYAYERHDPDLRYAYGYPIGAAIAKCRILSIDATDAKSARGVLAVVTTLDVGEREKGEYNTANLFGGSTVQHYHQAIALVVAETFEQARAAAALVKVDYAEEAGAFDLADAMHAAVKPDDDQTPDSAYGDFDAAFASAPVTFDARYTTPDQSHAAMEPHASVAVWEGDEVRVWTSSQMIDWWRGDLATFLGIDKDKIRLMSPYIGGGFGGKLFLRVDAVLATLGAKAVGRAVKVALPRPFIMNNTTHRPATIQRVRIGAKADGRIEAIAHESWSGDQPGGKVEPAVNQTRQLYAGANRMTAMRLATLDLAEGNAMRAPGEAPGLMALEIAMDEMANKLGMDPVEFRILNDTQVDPENPERPFSQRDLIGCLRLGAERFGWRDRGQPGSRRDGNWMIGTGVAA
ncbi:MAG: xanthine dehydrogenase family protein molybdopterin-binding subunit, partial [Alphaproteobacteria bacterium]|nr:xanthine dehydrogenase family protein molybdopterin-binding subunit [Alphaproteobacteria bacterium]